jgi:hypothetical protein
MRDKGSGHHDNKQVKLHKSNISVKLIKWSMASKGSSWAAAPEEAEINKMG